MKYDTTIQKIREGNYSRNELAQIEKNAKFKFKSGDLEALHVLNEIEGATPNDTEIVFMGFCPGADFENRLDIEWKEKGICRFDYLDSEHQLERFNRIGKGDLLVLKKREKFGKTMKVYGHGRVTSIKHDEDKIRYLEVSWSKQEKVIEIPLMGCNSTVDTKSIDAVNDDMPQEFFDWLNS